MVGLFDLIKTAGLADFIAMMRGKAPAKFYLVDKYFSKLPYEEIFKQTREGRDLLYKLHKLKLERDLLKTKSSLPYLALPLTIGAYAVIRPRQKVILATNTGTSGPVVLPGNSPMIVSGQNKPAQAPAVVTV